MDASCEPAFGNHEPTRVCRCDFGRCRRRRRGATPNHRRARRCASPKNIILDFLAPNSSFGDYNNMGGKVLVYKKSVMEVALEWVRAAVRRADECVKAL